jgi:hypothetical protein
MLERRRLPRQNKRLRGRIYFNANNSRTSLPCLIHDISYEGARIILADAINVPDEVDLYIPERKRIAHASVRWRHGDKLGLALSDVERHAAGRPSRLRDTSTNLRPLGT